MNLRNNTITVGELLAYPPARAVFERRFPHVMKHPLLASAKSMTLEQLIAVARSWVSQREIQETLMELRRV